MRKSKLKNLKKVSDNISAIFDSTEFARWREAATADENLVVTHADLSRLVRHVTHCMEALSSLEHGLNEYELQLAQEREKFLSRIVCCLESRFVDPHLPMNGREFRDYMGGLLTRLREIKNEGAPLIASDAPITAKWLSAIGAYDCGHHNEWHFIVRAPLGGRRFWLNLVVDATTGDTWLLEEQHDLSSECIMDLWRCNQAQLLDLIHFFRAERWSLFWASSEAPEYEDFQGVPDREMDS